MDEQESILEASARKLAVDDSGNPLSKKALKKLEKEREKERRKKEKADQLAADKKLREAAMKDVSRDNYGHLPLNQSVQRRGEKRWRIGEIDESQGDQTILLRARVHNTRLTSSKLCFLMLRQQGSTIQGVLSADDVAVSKQMVKFAANITAESIVLVEGKVCRPLELIKSCTVQNFELQITKILVISAAAEPLSFSLDDASRPEEDYEKEDVHYNRVNLDTRLNNRVLDLRTVTNQAVFRIQSGVCQLFRDYLLKHRFVEIHTPKIIGAASEGGASVFPVKYFKTSAYLAQSPQLYKQICICSDFERVFEIAPVFRAEDSNTHRHLTEFVGLDLEMAFEEHYGEVLDLLDGLFLHIFNGLSSGYAKEIEIIRRQFPFPDFQFRPETLRLKYKEAVRLLQDQGVQIEELDDLSTENEKLLGKLVKEKYGTDFFILDKFPLAIRPFYTMPDPEDKNYSNSYDIFMRGEEIVSGAQRIHDSEMLETRAKECGVDPETIRPYLDAFKYGAPPHAGGGVGLERVVMLYLNLGNIRKASLFPRDPKRLAP